MTTDQAPAPPAFNLNPSEATERVNTDIYRVKVSEFVDASDDYMARMSEPGPRPKQWHIEWEGISFRFDNQEDPNTPPSIHRSVNLTDKNGAVMFWGTKDPEPGPKDSYPLQMSKYFAKLGIVIESDPGIINGMTFVCEQKELKSGQGNPINLLVPIQIFSGEFTGTPRIVKTKQGGGQTANGSTASEPAVTDDAAWKALAKALNGKNIADVVTLGLQTAEVTQNSNVMGAVASGEARAELAKLGSFDDAGIFTQA